MFYYTGLEFKSRKSSTWSNRQVPRVTGKFGLGVQNKAVQRLTKFCQECTGHSKDSLPTTPNSILDMDTTRWYQNQIDYILCSQNGEALYSQQKQDLELTVFFFFRFIHDILHVSMPFSQIFPPSPKIISSLLKNSGSNLRK